MSQSLLESYSGHELKEYVEDALEPEFKNRFCYEDVQEYVEKSKTKKVLCLFGLRRTGKTTMMLQAIKQINDYEKCMYIICTQKDSISDLSRLMKNNFDCKYFFIDEVTAMPDFIGCCSILAEHYSVRGKKVIISGTDSLSILVAKGSGLYDRSELVHTTYISYKEYNYLLGKSFDEYIQYGGTLTDGKTIYNKDGIEEYTNTAISANITHTLKYWENEGKLGILAKLYYKDEIPTFINKTIQMTNRQFVDAIINKNFISNDLGSLKQIMTLRQRDDLVDFLRNPSLNENIRGNMRIRNHMAIPADDENIEKLKEYLVKLEVLYEIPNSDEVIFTQPGMRYCFVEEEIKAIMDIDDWNLLSPIDKDIIFETLDNDVKGHIMEDILFYEFSKVEGLKVYKTEPELEGREIDIVLIKDNKMALVEVKHSSQADADQRKNLANETYCKLMEEKYHAKIVTRSVIYNGGEGIHKETNILYFNAERILKNIENTLTGKFFSENITKEYFAKASENLLNLLP